MMKRAARAIRGFAIVMMLALACVVPSVAYAKDANLGVSVGSGVEASSTFSLNQRGIRDEALSLIREYRQDALNDTRVKFVYGGSSYTIREYLQLIGMSEEEYLSPQWSNSLERIAIQRAAESNLDFAHARPNGESCFTASHNGVKSYGEILAGSGTIRGGMAMWAAEKEDYIASGGEVTNDTGHYYQLISPTYRYHGFACVGWRCAGEASGSATAGAFVEPTNLQGDYEIAIALPASAVTSSSLVPSATSVDVGKSVEIRATFTYRGRTFSVPATLASSDPSVARVSGSTVTGVRAGSATLTMTVGGVEKRFEFTVGARVMHRLYNQYTGEHFYTADDGEKSHLVSVGWTDEGTGWVAPMSGEPVYRLYNPYVAGGDHHYTLSASERDSLVAAGWRYEGVGWYSAPASTGVPLYRQYNSFAKTGTHNYTTSLDEHRHLVSVGWRGEGVAWYGVRASSAGGGTVTPDEPSVTLYDVTFVAGEGATAVPSRSVASGSTCSMPTPPTRGSDVFEGWYTDAACTEPFDFSTPITRDLTLYAKWTEMASITFRYNVPGVENKVVTVAVGQKLEEPEAPTQPGYRFTGWFHRNGTWDTLFDFSESVVKEWDGLVLDALWQRAEDLELNPYWGGDTEPGDYVTLLTNNPVSSAVSSDQRVAAVTYEEGSRSVNLLCTEPGVATITVTDDLGQTASYELHVSKRVYVVSGEGPVEVTDSRYDDALYVPSIDSYSYGTHGINLYSDSILGEDGALDGYEASLCTSEAFDASFEQFYETDDWNNRGYVYLSSSGSVYRGGRVYYARVRSFRVEGTTKVYGPWSDTTRIEVANTRTERETPAQYTYELYFLDAATGNEIYDGVRKNLFVKTDNPDPSSLSLTYEDGTSAIRTHYANLEYDDVEYLNPADIDDTFRKVEGGYLVILEFDDPGAHTFQLREANRDGYAVALEFTWEILDYSAARAEWAQGIIDEVTEPGMTSFEKMKAVCDYLTEDGRFSYFTNVDGDLVTLAAVPNNPYFKTYRWDSANSPSALCVFAELIGGFDVINNMYDDYPYGSNEWMQAHSFVELTVGDEKHAYSVCPGTLTGNIGEVSMIDFSDTSSMTRAA